MSAEDLLSQSDRWRYVLNLIEDLTDPDDCSLDHDGGCQTHAWFGEGECPHAAAKRLLGR